MDDLIYRQKAIATADSVLQKCDGDINDYHDLVVEALKVLSPAEPKRKKGKWIAYEVRLPDRTILNYRCSVCGRKLIGYNTETLSEAPFCHCGADMRGEQDE